MGILAFLHLDTARNKLTTMGLSFLSCRGGEIHTLYLPVELLWGVNETKVSGEAEMPHGEQKWPLTN